MSLQIQNLNVLWGSLIVEELFRNGIDYFCVSPGSRSTPLTVAAARHPSATVRICFDERGGAFHALGYARATGRPAAVITTSGTAVANCYPAVVEAAQDEVPLLILSSDRPPELRQTDANQTVQQPGVFARYCHWEFDLPCPTEKIPPQAVLTTVDQLVYRSRRLPAGPVHLNCMWREPLAPSREEISPDYLRPLGRWKQCQQPFTRYYSPFPPVADEPPEELSAKISKAGRGIIVAGKLNGMEEAKKVCQLARALGWPLLPDVTSGLRLWNFPENVAYYDQILLDEAAWEKLKPDAVLHFGGRLVSKRLSTFFAAVRPETYVLISPHPRRHDPAHLVTDRIESLPGLWADKLAESRVPREAEDGYLKQWQEKNRRVEAEIEKFLEERELISEAGAARILSGMIPEKSALFLASSMPVRDMDRYAAPGKAPVPVFANRGASGIDGTIACAVGAACGSGSLVTLVIGDLAVLHDLNSFSQLEKSGVQLIIVAINNGGGGIFSFLPIAQYPDVFENYFGAPHSYTFEPMANFFRLSYFQPRTVSDFRRAYQAAVNSGKSALIELITNREENYQLHAELQTRIQNRLKIK